MIESLKKEAEKVSVLGIAFTFLAIIQLCVAFDACLWLLLGFFAWCCFTYAKGNLRAIEYYEKQIENYEKQQNHNVEAIK